MIHKSLKPADPVPAGTDDLIESLSSGASRAILAACAAEPRPVKAICERTDLPPSTAYRHVNELVERGLLERTRTAMNGNGSRYDIYETPFESLELQVDEDGVTLALDGKILDR